jgi:MmoB/DmpM family
MQSATVDSSDSVGPVLNTGELANAIVTAIKQDNPGAVIIDRGSYLRVLVPQRCRLDRQVVERILGRPFRLPGDIELCMPSFKGQLILNADEIIWTAGTGAGVA